MRAWRRAANMRRFVADLAAVATLRVDPGEAADIVWATNAPEFYQLLVGQRGWSPERYEPFSPTPGGTCSSSGRTARQPGIQASGAIGCHLQPTGAAGAVLQCCRSSSSILLMLAAGVEASVQTRSITVR